MKILCLHGNGTNSHIMKMQTAALRHELGDNHTYEFVEAVQAVPMAEGMSIFSRSGFSAFAFYDDQNLETLSTAVDQLGSYIDAEGPFDAVLGFSAGATLIAAFLSSRRVHSAGGDQAPFKAAIFISSAACQQFDHLGLQSMQGLIDIPTAHIWGSRDEMAPNGGRQIHDLCQSGKRFTYIHEGGHEVPKKEDVVEAVHVIRRALTMFG